MERVICVVLGYFFGLIETGYIYGKMKNIDIRNHGSGNAGSTNALRTFGVKGGAITFIGDLFKAIIACLVVRLVFGNMGYDPGMIHLLEMYAGTGVVLGHDFPFYLGFKGGKGIASTGGLMLMTSIIGAGPSFAVFIIIALTTRYVSLASICAISLMAILHIVTGQLGWLGMEGAVLYESYGVMIFLAVLAIYKHKTNIKRLIRGEENKLSLGKKK